jgi:hypothetical protein
LDAVAQNHFPPIEPRAFSSVPSMSAIGRFCCRRSVEDFWGQ